MGKRRTKKNGAELEGLINPDSALSALSPKRQAFVLAYTGLHGGDGRTRWNGAAAARAAGYAHGERQAYELLRDPAVKAAVAEVLAELRQQHETLAQRAVDELTAAAFARIVDVVDTRGGYLSLRDDLPADDPAWAAVASVEQGEHGLKVKLHPKAQVVNLLLRAIGYVGEGRGPQVNVLQVNRGQARGDDEGLLTDERRERVRQLLGIRTTILDVEPGE